MNDPQTTKNLIYSIGLFALACLIAWGVFMWYVYGGFTKTPKGVYRPIEPRGIPTFTPQIGTAASTTLPAPTNIVPVYIKDRQCIKLMEGMVCN